MLKFKTDLTYCMSRECIHRRGCALNYQNYNNADSMYIATSLDDNIDYEKCIPNLNDINCTNNYKFLERFRLSDGSKLKMIEIDYEIKYNELRDQIIWAVNHYGIVKTDGIIEVLRESILTNK